MLLILALLSVSEKKDSIRVIITIVNISAIILLPVQVSKLFSFARFIDSMLAIKLHAFLFTSIY